MRNGICFYGFLCVSLGIASREIHPYSETSFLTHIVNDHLIHRFQMNLGHIAPPSLQTMSFLRTKVCSH